MGFPFPLAAELVDQTPDSATLQWHGGLPPFDVAFRADQGEWKTLLQQTESRIMRKKNLEPGHVYEFRVSCANEAAPVLQVVLSEAPTPPAPSVTMELSPNDSNLQVATVSWNPPGDQTCFELQYRPVGIDAPTAWSTASNTLRNPIAKKKNLPGQTSFIFRWRGQVQGKSWSPWSSPSQPACSALPSKHLIKLFGPKLLGKNGEFVDPASLSRKVIAIYYSASWCGPCRRFTPMLAQFYLQMKTLGKPFEVVFVSGDRDEASFSQYYASEMPWIAVPFASAQKDSLFEAFGVRAFPTLKVVDDRGNLIDGEAMQKPLSAASVDAWAGKAGYL